MRVIYPDNTFISPIDRFGRIQNNQIIIYARSGYGKGLISEGLVEWYHKKGYLCLILADPKKENEYAYQMFKPEEPYHLEHLALISEYVGKWKLPSTHDVKIYHPFSFDMPTNRLLPKMNIFTIPIKSLGRAEWGLLSEVHGENETVSVLLKASEETNDEEGIYSFAHYVQDSVKGKGSPKNRKADWKNFGLEATSGTMKELSKVSNILRPFKKHFFLSKQNCDYNINWKDVLTDQKNYHVFLNEFIKEEKISDFLVLYLLESVIKNKRYLKNPVLIVIPEISYLCGLRPEGHKVFLAESIKNALKTIRSQGRGFSTILDTQNYNDTDENVRDASTIQLYGELGGLKDVENVCKALGWGRTIKEQLSKAGTPRTYLIRGIEEGSIDDGGYLFFYPSAMHCEAHYNFEEMYRKHNKIEPEKYPMESYKDIHDKMKKMFKDDENKIRKKVKNREEVQKKLEEQKLLEKETRENEDEEKSSVKSKVKEAQDKNKETLMRLCYERYNDLSLDKREKTYRKIADKLGIKSHKTVKKYVEDYTKKLSQDDSKSYEDKFVEENNETESEGGEEDA